MSSVGAIGRRGVLALPVKGAQQQGVQDAFRDALPGLFRDNEKGMLRQLQAKPPQAFAAGTDKKGTLTLSYVLKDPADAKAIAHTLAGRYSPEDESWVGDNLCLPEGRQLDNFRAVAKGKQVQVTIQWSQE